MPGLQLDFAHWPTWLLVLLVAANLFKDQIGSLISSFIPTAIQDHFSNRAQRQADHEEHLQLLEEAILNGELQTNAAEQLRKSWREEQWAELLQRANAWQQETLARDLNEIKSSQAKLIEAMVATQHNTKRTSDILTTIHISLSKLAERYDRVD